MTKIRLDPGPFVVPMPTVLVGAEVEGRANFMPAAFVGIANYKPAIVACGLNPDHHTCAGIEANGCFSLNLPPPELVEATDWCGLHSGKRVDKSGVFETFTGELEAAPMIQACHLTIELKVVQQLAFAVDKVYFGEVVAVHADEAVVEDGQPVWPQVSPLIFTFPDKGYWQLGAYVAKAWSVGNSFTP